MALLADQLVYGSLYMDAGECSWEYAEHQIDSCLEKTLEEKKTLNDTIVGFDIIATRNQIKNGSAKKMGQRIINYIDKKYPFPCLKNRFVGVTKDEDNRPIRDRFIFDKCIGKDSSKYFFILE